jgi:hypothetical protein
LRTPSAASSHSREPRRPTTFFIDRSLGDRFVAEALRTHGLTVRAHKDHFPPDAKDEDWLREVGRRRWVVLTKDKMLRYRQTETTALLEAKVRAFVLTWFLRWARKNQYVKPVVSHHRISRTARRPI